MTAFFFKEIPSFRMQSFIAVRNSLDNLYNILLAAEIINTFPHSEVRGDENNFDIAVFTGDYCRLLIKKTDGYFSMSIPFQVVNDGGRVSFTFDIIGEEVSGRFISIMKNAIETSRNNSHSHEDVVCSICENYGLEVSESIKYYDAFATLISDDHGYLRFDDDDDRANGDIHPRYHFDIFFKNTSAIKIGYDNFADMSSFYALFDGEQPKEYLGR